MQETEELIRTWQTGYDLIKKLLAQLDKPVTVAYTARTQQVTLLGNHSDIQILDDVEE